MEWWESCLRSWLNPLLGDLPIADVNNTAVKQLVPAMVDAELSAKTIGSYIQVAKTVVASVLDAQGEQVYARSGTTIS